MLFLIYFKEKLYGKILENIFKFYDAGPRYSLTNKHRRYMTEDGQRSDGQRRSLRSNHKTVIQSTIKTVCAVRNCWLNVNQTKQISIT